MNHVRVRTLFLVASLALIVAVPLFAGKKHKSKQQGEAVEVTSDDPNAKVKAFVYNPKNATLTIGNTVIPISFENDGSVTFNGVNCKTNEQLLGAIATAGALLNREEIDSFLEMINTGEIKIVPPKRSEALVQLLQLWRSRL